MLLHLDSKTRHFVGPICIYIYNIIDIYIYIYIYISASKGTFSVHIFNYFSIIIFSLLYKRHN